MSASLSKSSPQNEADEKAEEGGRLPGGKPWKLASQRMGVPGEKGGWILRPRLRSSGLFPSWSGQLVHTLGRRQQATARGSAEVEVREGTRRNHRPGLGLNSPGGGGLEPREEPDPSIT